MKLYLITDTDPDDVTNNRDLFVWADTPEQAVEDWDTYFDSVCLPCRVQVREVPTFMRAGVVEWGNVPLHIVEC